MRKQMTKAFILVFGVLIAGLTIVQPASAIGTSGNTFTLSDDPQPSVPGGCDTVDYLAHPQNSLRPGGATPAYPYGNDYKYLCDPVQDIRSFTFDAGQTTPGFITASMTLGAAAPYDGMPLTQIPEGFTTLSYSWYFQNDIQHLAQPQRVNMRPATYNDAGPSTQDRISLFRYSRGQQCPAADVGYKDGVSSKGTLEANQIQSTTKPTRPCDVDTNPADPVGNDIIYWPPQPAVDGWWLLMGVDFTIVKHNDKLNGRTITCANVGSQPAPSCLGGTMTWGIYEGSTGVSTNRYDFNNNSINPQQMTWSSSGNTITVKQPYTPKYILGTDDDLLLDDVSSYPLAAPGAKITDVVPQTGGVVQAGSPWRICDGGDPMNPDGPVPAIANPVGPGPTGPLGYPLPNYIPGHPQWSPEADGGKSCFKYLTGLITVRDWAPMAGFELRAIPRAPGYTASPSSLYCRYPLTTRPTSPLPVALGATTLPPVPGGAAVSTDPYDQAWWIEVSRETSSGKTPVGPSVQAPGANVSQQVSTAPFGRDQACNYTYVTYGLHYKPWSGTDDITAM